MPTTFQVASHQANPVFQRRFDGDITRIPEELNVEEFFKAACYKQWKSSGEIVQTSLKHDPRSPLLARENGFVHTIVSAYGQHHHLKIRPDDVWIAVLTQLSFYVNAHAEELRAYFVAHDGQTELKVEMDTAGTEDFAHLARQMTGLMHENVVDKTLVEWILPDFTTSTVHDMTICSMVLMSTLKAYFTYAGGITCGIPSVTLEGEKSDWERLYARLDRLPELGDEPAQWASMLRPIFRRFVAAFDGEPDITFWSHVVHRDDSICGRDDLTGWITAFCMWDVEGKWLPAKRGGLPSSNSDMGSVRSLDGWYRLDGVPYFELDMKDIPKGYSVVDISIDNTKCAMAAGHVASAASRLISGNEDGPLDTLSPAPQWFMYVKADKERRGWEEEEAEAIARIMAELEEKYGPLPRNV